MTKNQFLGILEKELSSLSYVDRRDILYDYNDHFDQKMILGRTEEEISKALGSPYEIAKKYLPDLPATLDDIDRNKEQKKSKKQAPTNTENNVTKSNSTAASLILGIALIFLNITIVLPIYLSVLTADLSLIVTFFALVIIGITLLISVIFATPFLSITIPYAIIEFPVLGISAALILISLSGLLLMGCIYVLKYIIKFTSHYVQWNIKIVRGY